MTRIYTEGFECGSLSYLFPRIYSVGSISLSATARSGNYSLMLTKDQNAITPIDAISEIYARVGIRFASGGTATQGVFWWRSGQTVLGSVKRDITSKKLVCYTSTGTLVDTGDQVLDDNTFYCIEIHVKIHDTTGVIACRIDGVDDASFTGDTKPGSETTINNIYWYNTGSSTPGAIYIDDLAINDTNGLVDNSWCGDGHIIAVLPNGNGDVSGLDGSDGDATNNYLLVDDCPNDTATYVQESTPDAYDLYNVAAPSYVYPYVTINRIWIEAAAQSTKPGAQCKLGVKSTTESWDSTLNSSAEYTRMKSSELLTNHDTSLAWTQANLTNIQIGMKVV